MKYLYMDEQERQIQYYQFPKFLLELPLSQNARIIYMLLYDRARISRKNNWADEDGRVYAVFPIEELSQKTGKCKSSVKKALKELDDAGLLIRKFGGFSKPRHMYVMIPNKYVTNWQKMKQNHMGYLFWEPVGTGKSYLASCIANALLEQEVTVKMTNFNTILNDLFAVEDKTEYIRSLNGYELLIIDDLGVERNSEYALENIFSVIDRRYRSGKPLIITTNLPLVQLKQETKIEKKRIYDRILERCIPVKIDGVSRREAMANDNMQTMKNILKI